MSTLLGQVHQHLFYGCPGAAVRKELGLPEAVQAAIEEWVEQRSWKGGRRE